MDWDVWGAPLAVLGLGTIVGLILAVRSRGEGSGSPADEAWARKESLMDQLRSLRADRDKMRAGEFAGQFDRLVDAAARALRDAEAIESGRAETIRQPAIAAVRPTSWTRRAGWGVATLVFFTAVGFTLRSATSDRAGRGMTGGDRIGPTAIDARIEQLNSAHAEDPDDIAPINELTSIALQQGDLGGAMAWIDKARAIQPDHPELRTHLAILQASIGMTARAKAELEAAIQADPDLSKAHLWLGLLALRDGDRDGAIPSLEAALELAVTAEDRTMASRALGEARRPPATVQLRGSLALAPGATPPNGGVAFVMVRGTDSGVGPPVAAVRLNPRGIPGTFSVTDRDMMMGGQWPSEVWVEARLDTDGDPTTREATDLVAPPAGPFAPGAAGANLVLEGRSEAAAPTATAAQLSGTIDVSTATALPESGAVFVIVRRTDATTGPPVAAVRMERADVPGSFAVTSDDLMMGGPWPEAVWVQVRVDGDGNAMTKDEADVASEPVGPVTPGTDGIVITL